MKTERTEKPFYTSKSTRPLMLKLHLKNGDTWGLAYSYLLVVNYDVTGSIELQFSFIRVVVEGQHLSPLFEGLAEQTIDSIREADSERDLPYPGTSFVKAISLSKSSGI